MLHGTAGAVSNARGLPCSVCSFRKSFPAAGLQICLKNWAQVEALGRATAPLPWACWLRAALSRAGSSSHSETYAAADLISPLLCNCRAFCTLINQQFDLKAICRVPLQTGNCNSTSWPCGSTRGMKVLLCVQVTWQRLSHPPLGLNVMMERWSLEGWFHSFLE